MVQKEIHLESLNYLLDYLVILKQDLSSAAYCKSPTPHTSCFQSHATVFDVWDDLAERLIFREWKSPFLPSFRRWMTDMISVIQMERFRFLRTNSVEKFWDPFPAYLDRTEGDYMAQGYDLPCQFSWPPFDSPCMLLLNSLCQAAFYIVLLS